MIRDLTGQVGRLHRAHGDQIRVVLKLNDHVQQDIMFLPRKSGKR